ncbi:11484_t:CDS:1, partial [Ambispora leptoticha]
QEQITNLQQEVQYYQTLYEKRVEKDLANQGHLSNLENKITALEKQLFSLAKQKIKGKKEAEQLLNNLETN